MNAETLNPEVSKTTPRHPLPAEPTRPHRHPLPTSMPTPDAASYPEPT